MSLRSLNFNVDRKAWWSFILMGLLVLPGCRKARETSSLAGDSAGASAESGKTASVLTEEKIAPPPPPPPDPSAPGEASEFAESPGGPREQPMDISSLNTVLQNYIVATDKVPKSIEEMVKLKLLPRMPSAPPGKKLVLDTHKQQIVLQNK